MKLFLNKTNPNQLKKDDIQKLFRRVFLSQQGQEVLNILLYDWNFFDICDSEPKRALNEYAKTFLRDYLGQSRITVYTELEAETEE